MNLSILAAIAVAISAPAFGWRLLPAEATSRIQQFFPELDIAVYADARSRLETELKRVQWSPDTEALFKSLIAPSDGLVRFHAKGTRLAPDSVALLDAIFDRCGVRGGPGLNPGQ